MLVGEGTIFIALALLIYCLNIVIQLYVPSKDIFLASRSQPPIILGIVHFKTVKIKCVFCYSLLCQPFSFDVQ